jgi:hypothetical protein
VTINGQQETVLEVSGAVQKKLFFQQEIEAPQNNDCSALLSITKFSMGFMRQKVAKQAQVIWAW